MDSKATKRTVMMGLSLWLAAGAVTAQAGTFGRVVSIGGHASDLALDEARSVLYVANFTANRVEVVSMGDGSIQTSINVPANPSSLSVSPDGKYLLVGHYGNFTAPSSPANGLTLIDLNTRNRQAFALGAPVLGVAFGIDGQALVVTNTEYILFDPVSGASQALDTIANINAKALPVPPANFPPDITNASVAVSGDGRTIYGLGGSGGTFTFKYDVNTRRIGPGGIVLASGVLGPRVVSLNQNGSRVLAGWVMVDERSNFINYFKERTNQFSVGSTAFDTARNVIYAQIPAVQGETPALQIVDADNLAVIERLWLPENLAGKSVLSSDGETLYAVSDSGIVILPVGRLNRAPRVAASVEDLVFRGNFCDRRVSVQEIRILDPGGGSTPFSISSPSAALAVSPSSGVTPATVRVTVDPNAFSTQKGTVTLQLTLKSEVAVNVPSPVRVLVNNREPDQRGVFVNVAGKLADLIPDPVRDRFYLLRQDKNQVLVFDGSTYSQIAALKTYNSPTSMAVTFDRRYLIVGHDSSQAAAVYDLETLESQPYIATHSGAGNQAVSVAASANAILAAAVDFQGKGHIIKLDLTSRQAVQLPTLGVYANDINPATVAAASPNGSSILFASSDGNVMLYNANADAFTVSRKDFTALGGAYAASSYDTYVAGNNLLNSSLVPVAKLEVSSGSPSGFAFIDQNGFRTTSSGSGNPGVIQRIELTSNGASVIRPTRMIESPITGTLTAPFTRTLAPLYSRRGIINLTVSGFTVLAWTYDEAVAPPRLSRVVSAADQSSGLAPGSLMSILGSNLSPVNIATKELPLPTALGESCLTVNGLPVPVLFVSPAQINAQMPYNVDGNVQLVLRTPGGVSDNFNLVVLPAAPAVFRSSVDPETATVVRIKNGELATISNPIHRNDQILVLLSGLGRTDPAIDAGVPAPSDPAPLALIPASITLGGMEVPVAFAGLIPGQVGVYQIQATVPGNVPLGAEQSLVVRQGGASTEVRVRVVD